jgi:cystathionine beta-lyase/cystathionine gamma-synthase
MLLSSILSEDRKICLFDSVTYSHNAINPPIYQSSLFTFNSFKDYYNFLLSKHHQYAYARGDNPTTNIVESKLAALERGEACRLFSSGMAAVSSALISNLKSGDHVIFINSIFKTTLTYASFLERFNIGFTILPYNEIQDVEKHVRTNTKVIFTESPGSIYLQVVDIKYIVAIAKKYKLLTILDNTCLTPLYQKPLELGIDISLHSCSKYLSGHSDLMAGAIISTKEILSHIDKYAHKLHGAVISPHDSFLLLRGLRGLPSRLDTLSQSTSEVVKHPKVKHVYHPLTYNRLDKKIFDEQSLGYTGLISFDLKANNYDDVALFIDNLDTFHIGFGFGGHENIICAPNVDAEFQKTYPSSALIRLSLGLFDSETIISDLRKAFDFLK